MCMSTTASVAMEGHVCDEPNRIKKGRLHPEVTSLLLCNTTRPSLADMAEPPPHAEQRSFLRHEKQHVYSTYWSCTHVCHGINLKLPVHLRFASPTQRVPRCFRPLLTGDAQADSATLHDFVRLRHVLFAEPACCYLCQATKCGCEKLLYVLLLRTVLPGDFKASYVGLQRFAVSRLRYLTARANPVTTTEARVLPDP